VARPEVWLLSRCPFLASGLLPGWGVTRGCGVLGGRRKGRVVGVSGGVRVVVSSAGLLARVVFW